MPSPRVCAVENLQVQTRAGDEPSTQWLEGGEMSAPVSLDVVASDVLRSGR